MVHTHGIQSCVFVGEHTKVIVGSNGSISALNQFWMQRIFIYLKLKCISTSRDTGWKVFDWFSALAQKSYIYMYVYVHPYPCISHIHYLQRVYLTCCARPNINLHALTYQVATMWYTSFVYIHVCVGILPQFHVCDCTIFVHGVSWQRVDHT